MRRDRDEGFDYPVANPDICIGCGKCESVCPVLNPLTPRAPLAAYAVRSESYVAYSSSGGIFPAVAKSVIDDGGVVFGAVMEDDLTVGHAEAETMEAVERMRGSKYVQSDMYSVYFDAMEYLKAGRKVLFTGTPCQIAGLKKYLGSDYVNLITADIACHGVPSPGLWDKYIKELQEKRRVKVHAVNFRDKLRSWRHYSITCYGTDLTSSSNEGKCISSMMSTKAAEDPYMALFMQDMTLRPSCYICPSRGGRSCSDLTFSDLWSVASSAPQLNDDKGVSGVLVNSEKGADILSGIQPITIMEVPVDAVKAENNGFAEEIAIPEKRAEFFQGLGVAGVNVYRHMKSYVVSKPLHLRICRTVRSAVSSIKRRVIK
jgi:coenzyme F420-reducing hydrogenase beta subunit